MESSPSASDGGDETPCPSSATATSGGEDVVTSLESVQRTVAATQERTRSLLNEREVSHRNVHPMDGDDHWQRPALGRWLASNPKIGSIDGALYSNDGAGTASGEASFAVTRTNTDLTPLPGRSFDGGSLQQTDFSNWYADEPNSSLMIHEEPIDRSRTDVLLSSDSVSVPADELSKHQPFGSPSTVEDSLVERAAITALVAEAETVNLPSTEPNETIDAFVPFGSADEGALVRPLQDDLDSNGSQDALPSQRSCSLRPDVYPQTLAQKYRDVPVEPLHVIVRPRRRYDAERTPGTGSDRLYDGDASPEPEVDGARSPNRAQESVSGVPIGFRSSVSTTCSPRTTQGWLAGARPQTVTGDRIASMEVTAEGEDSAPDHMLNDAYETSPILIGGMRQCVPITARSECGCVQASLPNTTGGSWAAVHAFECLLQAQELTPLASTSMSMSCVRGQHRSEAISYPKPALVLRSTMMTSGCDIDATEANATTTFESPRDGESSTIVLATTSQLVSPIEGAAAGYASTAAANGGVDTLLQQCALHAQGTSLVRALEPLGTRAHANAPYTDAARVVADCPVECPPSQMKTMRLQDYKADPNVPSWVSDPRKRPASLESSHCDRTGDTGHQRVDINGASEMTVDALRSLRIPELSTESDLMATNEPRPAYLGTLEGCSFRESCAARDVLEKNPKAAHSIESSSETSFLINSRAYLRNENLSERTAGCFREGVDFSPDSESDSENQSGPRSVKWSRTERFLHGQEEIHSKTSFEPDIPREASDVVAPSKRSAERAPRRSVSIPRVASRAEQSENAPGGSAPVLLLEHRRDRKRVQRQHESVWRRTASVVARSLEHAKWSMQRAGGKRAPSKRISVGDASDDAPPEPALSERRSLTKSSMPQTTRVLTDLSLEQSHFSSWALELEQTIARLASPVGRALSAGDAPSQKMSQRQSRKLGMRMFDHFRQHHFGLCRRNRDLNQVHEAEDLEMQSGKAASTSSFGVSCSDRCSASAGTSKEVCDPFPEPASADGFTVAFKALERRLEREGLAAGATFEAARQPLNRHKNRYSDVLPFDRTRVRLLEVQLATGEPPWLPDTDYINASWIRGVVPESRRSAYIATQGPCSVYENVRDFWHMVAEQRAPCVVMLARTVERGREKSARYMQNGVFGAYRVRLLHQLRWQANESGALDSTALEHLADANAEVTGAVDDESIAAGADVGAGNAVEPESSAPFILRVIELERVRQLAGEVDASSQQRRALPPMQRVGDRWRLLHIQYTAWPDHGVPATALPLIQIVDLVNQARVRYGAIQASFTEEDVSGSATSIPPRAFTTTEAIAPSLSQPDTVLQAAEVDIPLSRLSTKGRYGPVIVHCSAGIGRTGTWIALHLLLEKVRQGLVPPGTDALSDQVAQTVLQLRAQRLGMVQTPAQYRLLHEALLVGIQRWTQRIPPLQLDWDAITEPLEPSHTTSGP